MAYFDQRYPYRSDRVLIESERILSPEFKGITVQLSGSQVELLRGITEYLSRTSTFVYEYKDNYYVSPSENDWDDLQAIVADLEGKLMGNENTLFGVYERWHQEISQNAVPGSNILATTQVPEGYVYIVQHVQCYNLTNPVVQIVMLNNIYTDVRIAEPGTVPAGAFTKVGPLNAVLQVGDMVRVLFVGCTQNDAISLAVWGYKMIV